MAIRTEHDVQAIAAKYLAGTIPLHQLEDEILPMLWDDDENSQDVLRLAGTIQLALAEMARGDRSLESMRTELATAIAPFKRVEQSR